MFKKVNRFTYHIVNIKLSNEIIGMISNVFTYHIVNIKQDNVKKDKVEFYNLHTT